MAKDINIHVKTPGAQQAKQQLNEVGKSSQRVGDKTASGHKQAADAVDKSTQKLTGMGRILSTLKGQVMSLVGAWLGLQGVRAIINWLIQKLERIAQLQKDIYQQSLTLAQIGQALEMQTGTRGMQQYWAQQAAMLQAAGGLAGPGVAQQMMVSADIAFQAQGGIKSPQILAMLAQFAPFIGAQQMAPEEVAKLFEFAGTAGITPTPEAYKKFFAQLQAGYTASKATVFGQYLMGLQKGVTPYMAMGGTLEPGISAFVGARAVSPNEALAATLVEQMTRLASGAYERPRKAMERELGVSWETMTMDERLNALLQYVGGIPEARRGEVLAAQGFPIELTSRIGTMVSPEAMGAMGAAGRVVGVAGAPQIDQLSQDYLQSVLGKERKAEAEASLVKLKAAPEFADWQTRLKKAQADFDVLLAKNQDRWIKDSIEPQVMAIEALQKELEEHIKTLPEGEGRERAEALRERIQKSLSYMVPFQYGLGIDVFPYAYPQGLAVGRGYEFTREFQQIVYDNSTNYYPRTGSDERGPRVGRDLR